jgi:glucose-1-phosphate adenylyltransferase
MGAKNVANVNLTAILDYHKAGDLRITTVYKQLPPERIEPDDWTLSLSEQGTASSVIQAKERSGDAADTAIPSFMDMYVLGTNDLIELLEDAAQHQVFRRLPELLRDYVLANNANAFEYTGYLARIDSIPRYYLANMEMLDDVNFQSLLLSSVPILTKSKNEVPSFFAKDSTVLNSLLGTGTYIEGTVQDSVVFRNVVVHRDATVDHSIVMQGAKISTGTTVEYAILDKGVVIGPNLKIAGTPEKPLVLRKNQTVFRESELEVGEDA